MTKPLKGAIPKEFCKTHCCAGRFFDKYGCRVIGKFCQNPERNTDETNDKTSNVVFGQ